MKASPIENETCKCALPLGQCRRGFRGTLVSVCPLAGNDGYDADELELRLLELGFIEGASVHILHEGPFGHDPIAVRVNDTTVALRRAEAMAILAE
ncbi:FeoA family protein [Thioclava sediminum]|uniref:FeoA family protein n=1 Tax=Thioclava sediminum TaxID=1915319 RepID=UPI00099891F9|nr:FeoA family protein [Thioclava sediminum]